MNKLTSKLVAAGAACALAAAVATPLAAQASTARGTIGEGTIYNCAGKRQIKPKTFTLYCGDGNDVLIKLKWSGWGSATATATGSNDVNLCDPSCAAGKDKKFPVTVKLTDLKTQGSARNYTKLTLTYTGKKPAGQKRVEHFNLTKRGPEVS